MEIDARVGRDIRHLPRAEQGRIIEKIDSLGDEPRPPGCVKLAGGGGLWRIRMGDYRVIYQISDKRLVVIVVKIGHRRDVYR